MTEILEFHLESKIRPTDPSILCDCGPPRALYKVNPRLILGKEWWDKRRKQAYHEFCSMCAACGISYVELQAHELYDINKKTGKVKLKDVVPLCKDCHSFVHQDLHRALLAKGELKTADVVRILKHGKRILRQAGICCKRNDPNDSNIEFNQWRLVIGENEYSPIFGNNARG